MRMPAASFDTRAPSTLRIFGEPQREKIMLYCKGLFDARNDGAEARRFNRSLIEA
jgi:hypothetical protein